MHIIIILPATNNTLSFPSFFFPFFTSVLYFLFSGFVFWLGVLDTAGHTRILLEYKEPINPIPFSSFTVSRPRLGFLYQNIHK